MTVLELLTQLQRMVEEGYGDTPVRVHDTFWESEGYGEMAGEYDACYPTVDLVEIDEHGSLIIE